MPLETLQPVDRQRVQRIARLRASPAWASVGDDDKAEIARYLTSLVPANPGTTPGVNNPVTPSPLDGEYRLGVHDAPDEDAHGQPLPGADPYAFSGPIGRPTMVPTAPADEVNQYGLPPVFQGPDPQLTPNAVGVPTSPLGTYPTPTVHMPEQTWLQTARQQLGNAATQALVGTEQGWNRIVNFARGSNLPPEPASIVPGALGLTPEDQQQMAVSAEEIGQSHPLATFAANVAAMPLSMAEPAGLAAMIVAGPMGKMGMAAATPALETVAAKFGPRVAGMVEAELRHTVGGGAIGGTLAAAHGATLDSPQGVQALTSGVLEGGAMGAVGGPLMDLPRVLARSRAVPPAPTPGSAAIDPAGTPAGSPPPASGTPRAGVGPESLTTVRPDVPRVPPLSFQEGAEAVRRAQPAGTVEDVRAFAAKQQQMEAVRAALKSVEESIAQLVGVPGGTPMDRVAGRDAPARPIEPGPAESVLREIQRGREANSSAVVSGRATGPRLADEIGGVADRVAEPGAGAALDARVQALVGDDGAPTGEKPGDVADPRARAAQVNDTPEPARSVPPESKPKTEVSNGQEEGRPQGLLNDKSAPPGTASAGVDGSKSGDAPPLSDRGDDVYEFTADKAGWTGPERRFRAALEKKAASLDATATEYATIPDSQGGKVFGTDIARELSPQYRDPKNRTLFTKASKEPAAKIANALYEREMARRKAAGETGEVVMTAGGAGAGKSTYIRRAIEDGADVVFDSQMTDGPSAIRRIQAALDQGDTVRVTYVHRPFAEAVRGSLLRAESNGRFNTLRGLAGAHVEAQRAIHEVAEHFKNDSRVVVEVSDNSARPGLRAPTVEDFAPGGELRYGGPDELLPTAQREFERARSEGRISNELGAEIAAESGRAGPATARAGNAELEGSGPSAREGGSRASGETGLAKEELSRASEPKTIEQRLLDFADRMKQERAQTPDPRRGGSKPGQRPGNAPIFKDTVTLAAELAARAAAKGIQAAKAIRAFVHEQMGAKEGDPEARRVTRIVRGILSDSVKDGKVDYDAFEYAANAAREAATKPAKVNTTTVREATGQAPESRSVTERAALKASMKAAAKGSREGFKAGKVEGEQKTLDRVVPKAVREVKRAYREGRAREAAVTAPALESMERVIKAIPKRTKAAMELARRGGADEAKAAQDVRDAMRKQVLDMAGDAPPAVRGRLLKTLADADTPGKMLKAMRSVQRDTYRAKARGDWAWINRKSKPGKVKGMTGRTEPFVQEMATLRAHAETAKKVIRQKDVSLTDARAATEMLSKIRDEMGAKIKQAQSAHEVIKGMRGLTAIQVADNARQKVEAKSKEADVEGEAKTPDENRALGIVRSIGDIRNALQRVEGPNGPIKEVVYDRIAPAESKQASIERDSLKEAEALARDVGYKDLDELEAALSPNSGKGVTKTITVQLAGVQRKITLGEALDLYGHATDSETASLMAGNQQFVPERGRGTVRMDVNPNDMIALRLQLEQDAPGLIKWIDGHKKLLQDLRVEERKVIYRLTGKEPIDPPTRWWRERVMEQAPYVKDTSPGPAKFDFAALLETAGVNKDRVQTDSVPILLRNPVAKLRDEIRRSSKTIALAEPIRDAFNVLSQRDLAESINKRFGTETMRRLEKQLTALYADPPPPDGGGRFAAAANSTLHVTALAGNPGSMAGNAVGAIRIIPELPAQHLAGAIKDLLTKPRELFNDLRERSGFMWERFNRPYQERSSATGAAGPSRSDAGFLREMRRAGLNIKAGDVGAAFGDIKNAMKSTLSLYNTMDAPGAIIAYAGKIRESKEIHPGWTEGQHKDWAATQADQIIRDTQPGNSPLDSAFAPTAARGTVQAGVFTFQGDIMRTRNRIAAAFGESRERGIKVLSSEVANIVVSRVTKRLVNAGLLVAAYAAFGVSNDEKKKELAKALDPKEVGIALGKDVGDLVFPQLGSAAAGAVGAAGRAMGKPNLVPMPGVDAVEEAGAAVLHMGQQIATAIERGIKGKTIDTGKLLKSIRDGGTELVNVGVGNPLSPILRKVYKAYDVKQGEADPRKIIAAYRADSGILEADKAKRDVREDIWDAIAENDTAKARRAFNNAKAEKVPLSFESLKELIRGKHPLAGVPEKDRPKFIASLSPEKKRAMEKAIKEYEVQRNRAGRVIQEAIK